MPRASPIHVQGISAASLSASPPQPPRKPPPSSPSPRTPPRRCSSAGRYRPLRLAGCHGVTRCHTPSRGAREQPLTVLPTQPPAEDKINGILLGFRLRYRELVYDSLRGFTLRGVGNPSATWAELTRECLWSHRVGGTHGWGAGAGQHPALHGLSRVPAWSCRGQAVPHGAVTGPLVPPGPWSLSAKLLAPSRCAQLPSLCPHSAGVHVSVPNLGVCVCAAVLRPRRQQVVTSPQGAAGT